jgi:hypothetical protein
MTDFNVDIKKELVRAEGAGFQLQDQHNAVNMGTDIRPELLTALMGGANQVNKVYGQTHVFQYDETKYTPQLVSGKRFDERGKDIAKDKAVTRYYEIGSKGIRLNVAPEDYDGRRKAGTNEMLTEADVLADQIAKAQEAFMLETELEYAQLLTVGTNRTSGGPAAVYDFHNDILGSSRAAAITIDFASTVDPHEVVRKQKNLLANKLAKYGLRAAGYMVIAGDSFMDAAYEAEKLESLGRPLKSTLDLASQAVPTIDSNGYRFDNFLSELSGVEFVRYGSEIIGGTKLIGDKAAYMIPLIVGEGMVKEVYAPAKVRGIVNTQAREMYSWFYTDDFSGVTGFYEQNRLTALVRPDLIVNLDIA